ncbi:hypothetical protein ACFPTY_14940 [Halomonas beimenensis]|uniref:Type 4 fimbrial biogenesis protein PilX N-terminal domain-containing protein n=1 Tax=Halomonas beimenensis TaxID=475662 RepID=A0A291PBU4_9GAMM|nr:hypothetical protein [Halomonas beimenensis]ATJ84319.1 hypothetical protein BEI_3332 [Halomonas beimenensis]
MKIKQQGMALTVSLVLLVGALVVAVGGLQTAQLEEASTGNNRASANALMAAEYGASEQLAALKSSGQGPSDFSDCTGSPSYGGLQSVSNTQDATAGFRVETCRSGVDAIRITVQGEAGQIVRTIQIGYTQADSTFLGLSTINFPGHINSFDAPNSNSFIVEGAVDESVSGGQRPAISTHSPDDDPSDPSDSDYDTVVNAIEGAGREDNYNGGISTEVSESLLTDPAAFSQFVADIKSYANDPGNSNGQVISEIDTTGNDKTNLDNMITVVEGDLTLSGNASGSGILIVEGDYGTSGTPQFDGLIIVQGDTFGISGGGHGGMNGALIMAPMPLVTTTDEQGNTQTNYSDADVVTNGGGNAAYSYDADALTAAFNLLPTSLQQEWMSNNVSTYAETEVTSWQELL